MPRIKKPIHIQAETLYKVSVITYIFALVIFLLGWYLRKNILLPTLFCLPLILMTTFVIGKRRRYYQFVPNILVLYIGWTIAEIFVNKSMHVYGALALVAWLLCLTSMLLLIRTRYLKDGEHYISTRKNKSTE